MTDLQTTINHVSPEDLEEHTSQLLTLANRLRRYELLVGELLDSLDGIPLPDRAHEARSAVKQARNWSAKP